MLEILGSDQPKKIGIRSALQSSEDLKPMNLLLTQTLDVKVSDFGTGTPPKRADTRKKQHDGRKDIRWFFCLGFARNISLKTLEGFIGRCVNE